MEATLRSLFLSPLSDSLSHPPPFPTPPRCICIAHVFQLDANQLYSHCVSALAPAGGSGQGSCTEVRLFYFCSTGFTRGNSSFVMQDCMCNTRSDRLYFCVFQKLTQLKFAISPLGLSKNKKKSYICFRILKLRFLKLIQVQL